MRILPYTATRFEKVMEEGRTHPVILSCRSANLVTPGRSLLVKAIGCPELHSKWQLVAEVVGNAAARQVGVLTPAPAVVEIPETMASLLNAGLREQGYDFRLNAGHAAGCDFLPGISPWTIGQTLSSELRTQAMKLFAFDMMSQNPDRRRDKVNCGLTRAGLLAYDFELCFAHCFVPLIGSAKVLPWEPSNAGLDRSHLFYAEVRADPPDLEMVRDMALSLTPAWWSSVQQSLPEEWHHDAEKIGGDLLAIYEHADEFAKDVTRRCLL